MDIACVIFCIAMFFVGKKTEKKVINPLSVFCLLWGIVIFLSNIHLFNLYLPKESIKVGNNAIIGANAVIIDDVPEYGIAVGVPARVINNKGE